MRPISLIALALLAACTMTGSVRQGDVETAFREELGHLRVRIPSADDLDPARAANAPRVMTATESRARLYLQRRAKSNRKETTPSKYVRSLLACSLLAQGRPADARAALKDIKRRREDLLSAENTVITAALHAVGASRAVAARSALDEALTGKMDVDEFLEQYGSFIGVDLPDRDTPNYAFFLSREVAHLRMNCFKNAGLKPEKMELNRADLRRLIAEQVYNDAASLLVLLDGPPPAEKAEIERWLAIVAVSAFIVHGELISEILPVRLTEEQKQWQREQILPTYHRAKLVAGRFLSIDTRRKLDKAPLPLKNEPDVLRRLYARLRSAEIATLAWIDTR